MWLILPFDRRNLKSVLRSWILKDFGIKLFFNRYFSDLDLHLTNKHEGLGVSCARNPCTWEAEAGLLWACVQFGLQKETLSPPQKKSTKAQPIKAFTCKPDRPIFSLRATGRRKPSPKSCPLMSPCTPWLPSPSCIQTQNKGKPSKNKNDLEKSQERLFHFCRFSHFTFQDWYTVNAKYRKGCGSLTMFTWGRSWVQSPAPQNKNKKH